MKQRPWGIFCCNRSHMFCVKQPTCLESLALRYIHEEKRQHVCSQSLRHRIPWCQIYLRRQPLIESLKSQCLWRQSNFLASTHLVTVLCLCVCCIVCVYNCVMVICEPHTNKVTYAHAQGSDRTLWSQKANLSLKAMKLQENAASWKL